MELGVSVEASVKHDDMAPITAACMAGHLEVAKYLFVHGARITGVYSKHWATPLYQACRLNHYDVVQWLVENAVEANDIDAGAAATPLGIAVIFGHLRIVKFLISRGANTTQPIPGRDISLCFLCAMKGNTTVLKYLVENGIVQKQGADGREKKIGGPIKAATRGRHLDMVEYLIKYQDADVTEITACLPAAIESKQMDIVKLLIAEGADVNAADTEGNTPLYHAVHAGCVDAVNVLLVHGADVHQRASSFGHSAIHEMARCGHVEMIEAVVQIASDFQVERLNIASGRWGEVPLHKAAASGQSAVVRYLLQMCPIIVDILDFKRSSPLLYAVTNGHLDVVRILIEHGATIDCESGHSTPLILAAAGGNFEVVQFLCENGAQVSLTRGERVTPLIAATRRGSLEVVEYLLDKCHADANLRSTDDKTALSEAVVRGFDKIAHVLLAHGSNAMDIEQDTSDLLCQATIYDQVGMAKLLLKAGVNVNARYSVTVQDQTIELTPLTIAATRGHLELVRYLCENGADLEMATEQHESPLFLAALFGRLDVVTYLVNEQNANVGSADSFLHYTPIEMAKCAAANNIVEFLLTRGAAPPEPDNCLNFDVYVPLLLQPREIIAQLTAREQHGLQFMARKRAINLFLLLPADYFRVYNQ